MLSSRWNAFSRVDLVDSPFIRSLPGLSYRYAGPLPRQQGLTVDGGDLTGVITGRGDLEFADHLPTGLAYRLRPAAETLLLEPHGGLDILVAQALGARSITAVEPNPLIVEAAGAIYSRPGVEVVVASGRSYARGTDRRFDLVTVSLTAPYRPVRSGAYSLAEDYRYTVEAFASYLDLLAPGGILQATRWLQSPPSEETRLFALVVESLVQQGVDPAGALLFFRGFNTATVLVKPAGFTAQELGQARTWLAERSFDLVFAPDVRPEEVNRYNILQEPVYYQAAVGLLNATDREAWYEGFPFDVTPPTDNHPFFGHFFKWSQAAEVLQEAGHTWQPFGGAGYFVLVALLLLATAAALIIILLPLAAGRSCRPRPERGSPTPYPIAGLLWLHRAGLSAGRNPTGTAVYPLPGPAGLWADGGAVCAALFLRTGKLGLRPAAAPRRIAGAGRYPAGLSALAAATLWGFAGQRAGLADGGRRDRVGSAGLSAGGATAGRDRLAGATRPRPHSLGLGGQRGRLGGGGRQRGAAGAQLWLFLGVDRRGVVLRRGAGGVAAGLKPAQVIAKHIPDIRQPPALRPGDQDNDLFPDAFHRLPADRGQPCSH